MYRVGRAHLQVIEPAGNAASLEEMSQWWRAVGNTKSDLTRLRFELQSSHSRHECVTVRPTDPLNMINSLNLNKSMSHDNLSPYFLRVASTIAALSCFIDNAFRLGIFSQSCENVPLLKLGDTQNFTINRPIAILTCFATIFKKLIFSRLTTFFRKNSILTKTQYGFHSDDAILGVLTATYDNINN